ncbi:hypothetical protein GDO81_002993 [Engystomops pustulosus]|uniref:Uncharacterized protein n=1 Tax=Engystomops pustulosus TaxID=76066 RepID=A0AAV7DTM7_ENGPU|nr:hypothetical protein GDO81_002993 [Engystomops pustulosus]
MSFIVMAGRLHPILKAMRVLTYIYPVLCLPSSLSLSYFSCVSQLLFRHCICFCPPPPVIAPPSITFSCYLHLSLPLLLPPLFQRPKKQNPTQKKCT